jgi:hypothetical protein
MATTERREDMSTTEALGGAETREATMRVVPIQSASSLANTPPTDAEIVALARAYAEAWVEVDASRQYYDVYSRARRELLAALGVHSNGNWGGRL